MSHRQLHHGTSPGSWSTEPRNGLALLAKLLDTPQHMLKALSIFAPHMRHEDDASGRKAGRV